jgi:hypothetical protein
MNNCAHIGPRVTFVGLNFRFYKLFFPKLDNRTDLNFREVDLNKIGPYVRHLVANNVNDVFSKYVRANVCVRAHVCVCLYVCACVCARVCVCLRACALCICECQHILFVIGC